MDFEEFKKRMLPPIDVFNSSEPPMTVRDVMLAAYRLKNKYGISCITETMKALEEIRR